MLYDNALLLRRVRRPAYGRPALWAGGGDRRVPAARAADRRGRLRLGPRRRLRGRGGLVLRLDAGSARRGAGGGRRRLGGRAVLGHGRRHLRARVRPCSSCGATPTTSTAGSTCARGCWRAQVCARAPGARRQGGGRLERPGDQRSGAPRPWLEEPRLRRRGAVRRAELLLDLHLVAAGCAACPATASSALRPACWRTTGASPPGCSTCSRPPGTSRWLSAATDLHRHCPGPFAAGDGGFYDTADDADSSSLGPATPRQRVAERAVLAAPCAGHGRRDHRRAALPRGRDDALARCTPS